MKARSMTHSDEIILHSYDISPFSEKVRLALRFKQLAWRKVDVAPIMPRPELMALSGGYRRIPVLQLGADIFCDTQVILEELERRFPASPLLWPGIEGLASMIATWTDSRWFMASIGLIFGTMGDQFPPEFHDDRRALMGDRFDVERMRATVINNREQWRCHLARIERQLVAGKTGAGRPWLAGNVPSLLDVHAYMNPWLIRAMMPNLLADCLESLPNTARWMARIDAASEDHATSIDASEALAIAGRHAPLAHAAAPDIEIEGVARGDLIAVAPDDYGIEWVEGRLVGASEQSITLAREHEQLGILHLHFPRIGYVHRLLS